MIVVDASALLEVLLRTAVGLRLEPEILRLDGVMHAPQLLDLEVVQVLRRYVLARELTRARAEEALADFGELGIVRHGHEFLRARVWELRENLTAYDAAYVSLGEALDAPVITCDRKLAASAGHRAKLRLMR